MTDFTMILDKAKELEAKMKESQEKIKEIKAEGVSGSNSVKITLDGEGEMQKIELSDEILQEDKSIIEDLIVDFESVDVFNYNKKDHIKIFINGGWIGYTDNPQQLYALFKEKTQSFTYPIDSVPVKISSHNLDKEGEFTEKMTGIKGQYLIFKNRVITFRAVPPNIFSVAFPMVNPPRAKN